MVLTAEVSGEGHFSGMYSELFSISRSLVRRGSVLDAYRAHAELLKGDTRMRRKRNRQDGTRECGSLGATGTPEALTAAGSLSGLNSYSDGMRNTLKCGGKACVGYLRVEMPRIVIYVQGLGTHNFIHVSDSRNGVIPCAESIYCYTTCFQYR